MFCAPDRLNLDGTAATVRFRRFTRSLVACNGLGMVIGEEMLGYGVKALLVTKISNAGR